jgi:hypothetical protein
MNFFLKSRLVWFSILHMWNGNSRRR